MDWILSDGGEIMNGVHVLNMLEIVDVTSFGIACGILVLLFFVATLISLATEKYKLVILFIILLVLSGLGMFLPIAEMKAVRYEAIIDESVSYMELTEKYKVIEQRGEIFVLEEKTH